MTSQYSYDVKNLIIINSVYVQDWRLDHLSNIKSLDEI